MCTYLGLFWSVLGTCMVCSVCSKVHALPRSVQRYMHVPELIYISMYVVRAWYISCNDWNVPHLHGPYFNAPKLFKCKELQYLSYYFHYVAKR